MILIRLSVAGGLFSLTACGGASSPTPVASVNISTIGKLQLAVGTANIAGIPGLNVAATYRQSSGASAVLVDTPRLTGAFVLPAGQVQSTAKGSASYYGRGATARLGPSTDEVTNNYIGGSPQTTASTLNSGVLPTTFGVTGGVFGDGFAPANYTANGTAFSFTPFQEPIYAGTSETFVPWGGAPAFDPLGNGTGTLGGTFASQIVGIPLGLAVFQNVIANAGSYQLSVAVPSGSNAAAITVNANATLTNIALLPAIAPPTVTFDGSDNATIAYVLPPGVVGAYIQAFDTTAVVPFTFWVTTSGTQVVSKAYGPKPGTASPIASGDTLQVEVIGFDYNQYALQYNGANGASYPQLPALPAQADVTISPIVDATAP